MLPTVAILHTRRTVSESLQACLDFSCQYNCFYRDDISSMKECESGIDIILVDIEYMNDLGLKDLLQTQIKSIVLVKNDSDPRLIDAVCFGAVSYFNLKKGPSALMEHLQLVLLHKTDDICELIKSLFSYRHIRSKIVKPNNYHLTNKEKEILKYIREGHHCKLIAQKTGNTYETIRTHVKKNI